MRISFTIYGKKDCDLCVRRKEFIASFIKNAEKSIDCEFIQDYKDAKDPINMTDMIMEGVSDIPSVVMKNLDTGKIIKAWDGPEDFPTARKVLDLISEILDNKEK